MLEISKAGSLPLVFERSRRIRPARLRRSVEDGCLVPERNQLPVLARPRCARPVEASLIGCYQTQRFGVEKNAMVLFKIDQNPLERGDTLRPLELVLESIRPRWADLHFFIPLSGLGDGCGDRETGDIA